MNCWICGGSADSGEHIIKKSDLKQYFDSVSQSFPFLWYSNNNKKKLGGFKSNHLHFNTKICSKCNNERTQPSDRAWERLSSHIRNNLSDIVTTKSLDLSSLASNKEVNQFVVDVQLYFTKLLGCMIHDALVPINTSSLSSSIMSCKPHDSLYLMFTLTDEIGVGCKSVYVSDLRGYGCKDKVDYLVWQYSVGELAVFVIYDPRKLERRIIRNSLHPRNHNGKIRFLMKNNKKRPGGAISSQLV